MKTIAQQLKIKEFPFTIKDSDGSVIYREWSDGTWSKWEYAGDNLIYYENSDGYWQKWEHNTASNLIYYEDSAGFWIEREYDAAGNLIYREESTGLIKDNRPKTDVQKAIDLLTKEGLIVDGKILKTKL